MAGEPEEVWQSRLLMELNDQTLRPRSSCNHFFFQVSATNRWTESRSL